MAKARQSRRRRLKQERDPDKRARLVERGSPNIVDAIPAPEVRKVHEYRGQSLGFGRDRARALKRNGE